MSSVTIMPPSPQVSAEVCEKSKIEQSPKVPTIASRYFEPIASVESSIRMSPCFFARSRSGPQGAGWPFVLDATMARVLSVILASAFSGTSVPAQ